MAKMKKALLVISIVATCSSPAFSYNVNTGITKVSAVKADRGDTNYIYYYRFTDQTGIPSACQDNPSTTGTENWHIKTGDPNIIQLMQTAYLMKSDVRVGIDWNCQFNTIEIQPYAD